MAIENRACAIRKEEKWGSDLFPIKEFGSIPRCVGLPTIRKSRQKIVLLNYRHKESREAKIGAYFTKSMMMICQKKVT